MHLPVSSAGRPLRGDPRCSGRTTAGAQPTAPPSQPRVRQTRSAIGRSRPQLRSGDAVGRPPVCPPRPVSRPSVSSAPGTATRFPLRARAARPPLGISRSVCSCTDASPTRRRSGGQQSIRAEKRSPETANGQPMVTTPGHQGFERSAAYSRARRSGQSHHSSPVCQRGTHSSRPHAPSPGAGQPAERPFVTPDG